MNDRKLLSISTAFLLTLLPISIISTSYALPQEQIRLNPRIVEVAFPTSSDTWSFKYYPYMWNVGDYVEGTRNLGEPALIVGIRVHLEFPYNSLSCDVLDINVGLNGQIVGSFTVQPGETSKDVKIFPFRVRSPDGVVTIRYQVPRTVASGCGSVQLSDTASYVTLGMLVR